MIQSKYRYQWRIVGCWRRNERDMHGRGGASQPEETRGPHGCQLANQRIIPRRNTAQRGLFLLELSLRSLQAKCFEWPRTVSSGASGTGCEGQAKSLSQKSGALHALEVNLSGHCWGSCIEASEAVTACESCKLRIDIGL